MRHIILILLLLTCTGALAQQKGKAVKGLGVEQERQLAETFFEASRQKMLGNLKEAAVLFHDCVKIDPQHAASHFELANILYKTEQLADALPFARKARQLDVDNEWYILFEADILMNLGDVANAIVLYQRLIKGHPDKPEYTYELANAYLFAGKLDEAIRTYDQIETKTGVSEEISIQKEKLYLEMDKLDKAVAELEKLIAAFPHEQRYMGMLAEVYVANDDEEKAFKVYERMLANDADDPILHLNLAEYYKRKGDFNRSFSELKLAFASPDLNIDQKIQVLMSYYVLTEKDKRLVPQAFELLDLTIAAHPQDPKGFAMKADFLYRERKLEESREAFYHTIKLDSGRFAVWSQLIQVSYELGDHDAMLRDSETALELFPNQGIFYLFNGIALNQHERHQAAVDIMTEGEIFVKGDSYLHVQLLSLLGDSYNALGRFAESDRTFEKALAREPSNPLLLNNYSYFLSLRKESLEKAEEMSKRSNLLQMNQSSYLDTYAWIRYQQGEYADALTWIDKAIANGGDRSGTIVEHRGDILFRLGRQDEAMDAWKKAKELGEHSDALDRKIGTGKLVEE
ncbi:MAG: tetratricopeptide repeat protein [Flavobacteriales bacterium]|nr:tetratricopeptide repeat protein [Flavobacteriales bacterium]